MATRWPGALAGFLGAGVSLATIEVITLLDATGVSVTEAVGNRFIESFAASLKEVAVELFGTNDKAALQIGTVVVALLVGALLGTQAQPRPNLVVAGFAGFAVLGVAAAASDPLASVWVAVIGAGLGAVAGMFVTLGLERSWRAKEDGVAFARRAVLVGGGATAALVVLGVAFARTARESVRTVATEARRRLPAPKRVVAVPDGLPTEPVGISSYVTPADTFFRIDTALRVPVVQTDGWTLTIGGLVDTALVLTYDDLLDRDLVEVPITLQCVSNEVGDNLVGTARWLGVPLKELLDEAGVQAGAEQVLGVSVDDFTAGFPVELALDGRDALVAVGMNGAPLPPEHGFPARLVVPGVYGYVSATKWLREIRLTTWDEEGFWIPRGWSRLGPIKTQARIDVPARGADLAAGRQAVAGVAWAPHVGIEAVEVQVDDGDWEPATLGPVASADTWVQWWWAWDAPAGEHLLRVRATDANGVIQTADVQEPAPDGATGRHTIEVLIT